MSPSSLHMRLQLLRDVINNLMRRNSENRESVPLSYSPTEPVSWCQCAIRWRKRASGLRGSFLARNIFDQSGETPPQSAHRSFPSALSLPYDRKLASELSTVRRLRVDFVSLSTFAYVAFCLCFLSDGRRGSPTCVIERWDISRGVRGFLFVRLRY